jgi:hypothetical protein
MKNRDALDKKLKLRMHGKQTLTALDKAGLI